MHIKFLFFLLFPSFLLANDPCRPALLSLGAGIFDIIHSKSTVVQFQAEYKWAASWNGVQPFVSAFATTKGGIYVCGGACYDIFIKPYLVLTPSFGPGIYYKGNGKELGYPLEFRSSMALAYEFCNKNRIGAQFYHISNASLGFKNPGSESLVFFYSIAFK